MHSYVLSDFAKAERTGWVETLIDASADNAELLARGEDASFQNKIHLALAAKGFVDPKAPNETTVRQSGIFNHGLQMRHRRIAECRQVDAFQCADRNRGGAGGELSVLHDRAECRRGRGARSAARQARRARQVGEDHADAAHLRRHRGPCSRREQGRRARQPVPRQYPRGRRHRPCGALLRGFRRHPCRGQDRSGRRHRDDRDRIDAGRSRHPRAARRCAGKEDTRQRPRGEGDARSRAALARAAARRQAGARGRAQARGGKDRSRCSA